MEKDFVETEESDSILKQNCDHINKFLEELKNCNPDELSQNAGKEISKTLNNIKAFMNWRQEGASRGAHSESKSKGAIPKTSTKSNIKPENNSDGHLSSTDEEELAENLRGVHIDPLDFEEEPGGKNRKSLLEILVDKLDNKKVPVQVKFNEDSEQQLEDYLVKFEDYCQENIRGSKTFWVDELESRLSGDTLKAFNAIRHVNDDYDTVKLKLLTRFDDMKELRKKNVKLNLRPQHLRTTKLFIFMPVDSRKYIELLILIVM